MRCGARVQLALWFTALAGFTCAAAGGDPGVPAVGAAGPVGKAAVSGSNQRQTSEDAVTPAPYTYTLGGTWEQEWAVADRGGNQKFEALLEPRLDVRFRSGASLTAIARLRLDALDELGPSAQRPFNYSAVNGPWYNDGNAAIDLREFYLDMQLGGAYLRLGKQQVVWGESDGIKVLDVVNPQSFREFILKDPAASRIPLWTVNVELPAGPGGGSEGKPVGTVYVGLAQRDGGKSAARRFVITGDRHDVRERSARLALQMLRLELLGMAEVPLLWEAPPAGAKASTPATGRRA